MAGHSKWANIKHRKGRQDARRSKLWSKCARAIIVAARQGGGDPASNLTLRYAIDEARSQNIPKDTIENAIKKGTGNIAGVAYESIVYEGYGSGGVAIMIDCLTDNRNRTVPEIRKMFEKFGGNLGASGCVAYNFQSKGQVFVAKGGTEEEPVINIALEAGAEDVTDADESWQVVSDPGGYLTVRDALESAGMAIESAGISMIPSSTVSVTGKDARRVLHLIESLEDHDDVQKVHANFEISEEELALLSES